MNELSQSLKREAGVEIRGSCDNSNKLTRDLNSALQDSPPYPHLYCALFIYICF